MSSAPADPWHTRPPAHPTEHSRTFYPSQPIQTINKHGIGWYSALADFQSTAGPPRDHRSRSFSLAWPYSGVRLDGSLLFFFPFWPQQGAVLCAKLFHFCQRVWCGRSEITWIPQRKEIHHRGSFYCAVSTMYEWIIISLRAGCQKKTLRWRSSFSLMSSYTPISVLTIKLRDKHKWGWGRVDLVHSKLQSSATPERGATRK